MREAAKICAPGGANRENAGYLFPIAQKDDGWVVAMNGVVETFVCRNTWKADFLYERDKKGVVNCAVMPD